MDAAAFDDEADLTFGNVYKDLPGEVKELVCELHELEIRC